MRLAARCETTLAGARDGHAHSKPIDERSLNAAGSTICRELAQRVVTDRCSQAAVLDQVRVLVFGKQTTEEERLQFLVFAAPFARRIVLERANKQLRVLGNDVTVADVRELFQWCDALDPAGARILDLYYVAGISPKRIACVTHLHPAAVVRSLRFAKAWLRQKLGRLE